MLGFAGDGTSELGERQMVTLHCSFRWIVAGMIAAAVILPVRPTLASGGNCWRPHDDCCDDCDEDDLESELTALGLLFAGIGVTSPWWGPAAALEDHAPAAGFPRYPYEGGHGGFLVEDIDFETLDYLRIGDLFIRGNVDWGTDFEGVERLGANLHFETRNRWGFDAEWAHYEVDPFEVLGVMSYQTGDANVIFRFAESTRAHWWTGAGFNWYEDDGNATFGYNITYGVDVCLGNPWVLSAQFDAGEISHQSYFRGRTTIGVEWSGVEVFTGFDYFDFRNHHDAMLLAGVRAWF